MVCEYMYALFLTTATNSNCKETRVEIISCYHANYRSIFYWA